MDTIPEPTEQEIISSLGYDGHRVLYSDLDEDYGLLARIDRDVRQELKNRNGNGNNNCPDNLT